MNGHANTVGVITKDIYIIKNDINNKVYIGQSINCEERFKSHCKKSHTNSLIDHAIQKYGKEHFYYEILEHDVENYNEREKYWIRYFNSIKPNGYNLSIGGDEPPIFYGDNHPNVAISDENVLLLINDLKNTQISLSKLAKKYNISKRQIIRINQGTSRIQENETYPLRKTPNLYGKLTKKDVDKIIYDLKYTYKLIKEISEEFGVNCHMINNINKGICHFRENETYPIRDFQLTRPSPVSYEQVTDIINEILTTNHSFNSIAKKYSVNISLIIGINSGYHKKYHRKNIKYPLRKK